MRLEAEEREAVGRLRSAADGPEAQTILAGLGLSGHRLVRHLGLLLVCEPVTAAARLYYGDDSLALSERLLPVEGRALDLCAGAGAQALVCAQTAESVTAVEIEPLAERVFRINAELNGLSQRIEYLIGDLWEPVAGRQFDRICSNPPFMPLAPGVRYPRYADGGPDGLAVVRRVLLGLPAAMAANGQCDVVGAVLGNEDRPDLSAFEAMAEEARLAIRLSCPSSEALDEAMLASCAATALECESGDVKQAFREHWAARGATRLYYFLLTARHARQGSVYYEDGEVQRVVIGAGD